MVENEGWSSLDKNFPPFNDDEVDDSGTTGDIDALNSGDVDIIIPQKEEKTRLIAPQEHFCQLFVSREFFGNAAESYGIAFPNSIPKYRAQYAYELLRRPYISKRINELLDVAGLNDEFVDKQLLLIITQNVDWRAKLGAIKEYNRVRQRVIEKVDVTTNGKEITASNTTTVIVTGNLKE